MGEGGEREEEGGKRGGGKEGGKCGGGGGGLAAQLALHVLAGSVFVFVAQPARGLCE